LAITTDIDRSEGLTIYTVTGEVTLNEILETLEGFYASSQVTLNVLWDGQNARLKPLAAKDLLTITSYRKRHKDHRQARKGGKTAIVAPNDAGSGVFQAADMFKKAFANALPYEIRAFQSLEEAQGWLKA
jgi:hypothetical protein